MIDASTIEMKSRSALQVPQNLTRAGVSLVGKNVLDIGSGLGYNAKAMSDAGADVYTIEPDHVSSTHSIEAGLIKKERHTEKTLEDASELQDGKFDLATVLLWNINRGSYHAFFTALSRVIKPESGQVAIDLRDTMYINDPYGIAVAPHAKEYFKQVRAIDMLPVNPNSPWGHQILILSEPKESSIKPTTE
jgi:predicted O-methyltransferase YrrM